MLVPPSSRATTQGNPEQCSLLLAFGVGDEPDLPGGTTFERSAASPECCNEQSSIPIEHILQSRPPLYQHTHTNPLVALVCVCWRNPGRRYHLGVGQTHHMCFPNHLSGVRIQMFVLDQVTSKV